MRRGLNKQEKKTVWANAASWVRRRREAVKLAVEKSGATATGSKVPNPEIDKLATKMWTPGHEKEKKFNMTKEMKRRTLAI